MQRQLVEDLPANLPDIVLKYVRLSNPPDQIRETRKNHLLEIRSGLRSAILKLSYHDALKVASSLDGLMTMILLSDVVDELKAIYQKQLLEMYGIDTSVLIPVFEKQFEDHLDQIIAQKRAFTGDDNAYVVKLVLETCWSRATKKTTAHPSEEFNQIIKNLVFVIAASKVYHETDELQMVNISKVVAAKLKSFFKSDPNSIAAKIDKLTPEKIKFPYDALVHGFDLVTLTSDTAAKWLEVACYLLGLYNRIYYAIDKKYKTGQRPDGAIEKLPDGTYPTVDSTDLIFKNNKRVTKIEMGFENRMLGQKIEGRVQPYLANLSVFAPPSTAAAAAAADLVSGPRLSQATIQISWDKKKQERHIVINMPSELFVSIKEQLMDAVRISLDPSRHENQVAERLLLKPAYLMGESDKLDAKLMCLSSCLGKVQLTHARELMLSFVFGCIRAQFDAYRSGGKTVHSFVARSHSSLLEEYTAKLDATVKMADKIGALIELRNKLIGLHSEDMLSRLNKGLSEIYDVLALRFPTLAPIQAEQRCTELKGIVSFDIVLKVDDCNKDRVDSLEEAVRVVLLQGSASKFSGTLLPFLLAQMNHAEKAEKVTILGACLKIAQVTDDQRDNLKGLSDMVSASVQSYCSTYRYGVFQKAHASAALEFMEAITGQDLSRDMQLARLLDFRNALVAQNSISLLENIDKVLVSVFDVLLINDNQLSARAAVAAACGR